LAIAEGGQSLFWRNIDKDFSNLQKFHSIKRRDVAMPHRAASPAVSENEFDITKSLFKDDPTVTDNEFTTTLANSGALDADSILDLGLESNGDDDDAFIAAQQAASNRKASNLKGKSVKRGGGFQAMGT
jgi:ATP-dependent RNA helicase DDX54/DBP10